MWKRDVADDCYRGAMTLNISSTADDLFSHFVGLRPGEGFCGSWEGYARTAGCREWRGKAADVM